MDHYVDYCHILMCNFYLSLYIIDCDSTLGIEVLCFDFFKNSQMLRIYSGFSGSPYESMSVQ